MNNAKLRGRIREYYGYEYEFAKAMGMSNMAMSSKLNGKSEFKHDELMLIMRLLNFTEQDVIDIFFTPLAKKT